MIQKQSSPPRKTTRVRFESRGANRALFTDRAPELLIAGPAGTGKTVACLQKIHLCMNKYPRSRTLVLRKTLTSLTASALVTYQEKVLHPLDGVTFYGGSPLEPAMFRYPNGSKIVVGGMDRPTKVLSSEYDVIYVNEATELDEAEWEALTPRNRYGVMPFQQILADCNPDTPQHWLYQRQAAGKTRMLESRHEDNPRLYQDGEWTDEGRRYLAILDALTGARKLRMRGGLWVQAEGVVYEGFSRAVHLIDAFLIPDAWPRYWSVDFGYTNPFVWAAWAEDPDGRLYRYREIYMTHRLVEDHARDIKAATADEPRPRAIICDHDAEDRATLERHLGMPTTPAKKAISTGIQAVTARLRDAGDGRSRLFYMRDALLERDPLLVERKAPTCTEEEIEGYVWDVSSGRRKGEQPVDKDNHGMDMSRYLVMHLDEPRSEWGAV